MTAVLQGTAPDSLRRVLDEVFARPEYLWAETRHPLELMADLWRRLAAWLDALERSSPGLYQLLFLALVAVLLALVMHLGYVLWRVLHPTTGARSPTAAGPAGAADARAHLTRAEELARAGRYAEALAHRFLGLVLQLERARALVFHPSKTPAEYVAEARLDAAGRASLADLVGRLYAHLFGAQPCDEVAYREFGVAGESVLGHVVPG